MRHSVISVGLRVHLRRLLVSEHGSRVAMMIVTAVDALVHRQAGAQTAGRQSELRWLGAESMARHKLPHL